MSLTNSPLCNPHTHTSPPRDGRPQVCVIQTQAAIWVIFALAGGSAKMTFGIPSSTWICDAIRVTRGISVHARTHARTRAHTLRLALPHPCQLYHQPLKGRRDPAQLGARPAWLRPRIPAPPAPASDSSPTTIICRISGRAHQPQASLGLFVSGMIGLAQYPEPSLLRHSRQGM